MTCIICKQGETQARYISVTLERGGTAVELTLWQAAETAVGEGVEMVVRQYDAA